MIFIAGYVLGLATAGFWLLAEAFVQAARMKKRREPPLKIVPKDDVG